MITKCRFCSYYKSTPVNLRALTKLLEPDLPEEDYMLFLDKICKPGMRDYLAVKIHMGKMHKGSTYAYLSPIHLFDEREQQAMMKASVYED